jgi:hypothetical protein
MFRNQHWRVGDENHWQSATFAPLLHLCRRQNDQLGTSLPRCKLFYRRKLFHRLKNWFKNWQGIFSTQKFKFG